MLLCCTSGLLCCVSSDSTVCLQVLGLRQTQHCVCPAQPRGSCTATCIGRGQLQVDKHAMLPAGRCLKVCRAAEAAVKWHSCGLQANALRCAELGKSARCNSQICCASCRRMLQGVQSYCKTRGLPLDLEQRLLQVSCVLEVTPCLFLM